MTLETVLYFDSRGLASRFYRCRMESLSAVERINGDEVLKGKLPASPDCLKQSLLTSDC